MLSLTFDLVHPASDAAVRLDDQTRRAVFVSEGLGHGFMAVSAEANGVYLCSTPYAPGREHEVVTVMRPEEVEIAATRESLGSNYIARATVEELLFTGAMERLRLRLFEERDLGPLFEMQSDPDLVRYVPYGVRSIAEVRDALEQRLRTTLRVKALQVGVVPQRFDPELARVSDLTPSASAASRRRCVAIAATVAVAAAATGVALVARPDSRPSRIPAPPRGRTPSGSRRIRAPRSRGRSRPIPGCTRRASVPRRTSST